MASPLERFRAAERAPLISQTERARNVQNRFLAELSRATEGLKPTSVPKPPPDVVEVLGSTGPQVDAEPAPPTNAGVSGGTPYPAVLPPLTPEMARALAERRRVATSAFGQAEEDALLRQAEAQAANVAALNQLMEQAGREERAGIEALAARGVARSPMFVNRFAREQARLTQERAAELDVQLASTLSEIDTELRKAQQTMEREYADIDFETAVQRSAVNRLLGVA